jgi:hypothetical protein
MVKNFETLPKGTLLEIKTKDWKEIIEFLEYSENWAVPYSFRILVSDGGDLLTVKEFEFEIFYTTKAWLKNSKNYKEKRFDFVFKLETQISKILGPVK